MTLATTNRGYLKAQDSDNARTYLSTNLAATLDSIDTDVAAAATKTGTETLTNKTLTTPTIGDLTNAQHNHGNAAGGGTLTAAAIGNDSITRAKINAEAWTDWTPDVLQPSTLAGTTVHNARQATSGKDVRVLCEVTVGAAGTISEAIEVAIPSAIEPRRASNGAVVGAFMLEDVSASEFICGVVIAYSSTRFRFIRNGESNFVGIDPAIALANTDRLSFHATYEKA